MNIENNHGENWLPLARAAEILGSTPLNVLMHVKRGLLVGVERDGSWLIDPSALAALADRQKRLDVPTVCAKACSAKIGGCGSCG